MTQKALGRHDHQRLSPRAQNLAAQAVKVLSGSREIDHLNVFFSGDRQEPLESRAGMFRSLSLEAVGQQKHQAAKALPLVLSARDELIDYHLRGIPEVAELRLPGDQPVRPIETITVFESENASFGKWAVENFNRRLALLQVLKRRVGVTVFMIVKNCVTLAERAARG